MMERAIDQDVAGRPVRRAGRRVGYLKLALAITVLGAFGASLWYGYWLVTTGKGDVAVLLISADMAPTRKRPDSPGGMVVPHQDVLVYERLQRSTRSTAEERLLPQPETPLPRPAEPPPAAAIAVPPAPAAGTAASSEPVPVQTAVSPAIVPTTPTPPAVSRPRQGFRVQVASVRSDEQAQADWRRLVATHGDLLAALPMLVNRADLGPEKGIYYRIQVGEFTERSGADHLCERLKARGLGCLIARY